MLRLAVLDMPTSVLYDIAPRLRGATIDVGDASQCDALVCTASKLESVQIELLLEAGKRIFILVDTMPDALLYRSFASDPRITFVNPERFHPKHQLIRQQLGKLGEPGLLRLHRWEPTPMRLRDLDIALWYFAKTPKVVFAAANEVCTQIHLGFPGGGGMALLDYATGLPKGDTYYSGSLICAHGAAYADEHADMQLAYQGGSPRAIRAEQTIAQWTAMLQSFVEPSEAKTFYVWKDVMAVNNAIEQSLRTHEAVAMEGA